MSKRFLKKTAIACPPSPSKRVKFGGMQWQSFLKTLRHREYLLISTRTRGKVPVGKVFLLAGVVECGFPPLPQCSVKHLDPQIRVYHKTARKVTDTLKKSPQVMWLR